MLSRDPGHNPQGRKWTELQKLGVNSDISTVQEYERASILGFLKAGIYLKNINSTADLTPFDVSQAHRLALEKVHPWAGQFRGVGDVATFGSLVTADSQRIEQELQLAIVQTKEMLLDGPVIPGPFTQLPSIAFFHVRFERIHPFKDGNGRLGRKLVEAQLFSLYGDVAFDWKDRNDYMSGLRAANKGDLAPLTNALLRCMDQPPVDRILYSPFRVAPRLLEDSSLFYSLADDLQWSKVSSSYWKKK